LRGQRSGPDQRGIDFSRGIIYRVDHSIDAAIGQIDGLSRRQLAGSADITRLGHGETGDHDDDRPVVMKMHHGGQAGQRRPGNGIGEGQGGLIKGGHDIPGGPGRVVGPGVDEGPGIIHKSSGLPGRSRGTALFSTGGKQGQQAGSRQDPGWEDCPCRMGRWVHINS
jgi:hypothetical protein